MVTTRRRGIRVRAVEGGWREVRFGRRYDIHTIICRTRAFSRGGLGNVCRTSSCKCWEVDEEGGWRRRITGTTGMGLTLDTLLKETGGGVRWSLVLPDRQKRQRNEEKKEGWVI